MMIIVCAYNKIVNRRMEKKYNNNYNKYNNNNNKFRDFREEFDSNINLTCFL